MSLQGDEPERILLGCVRARKKSRRQVRVRTRQLPEPVIVGGTRSRKRGVGIAAAIEPGEIGLDRIRIRRETG